MRCKKCAYITFDFYSKCPKCGTSFLDIKQKLNIIDYSIDEESNYLIPEKPEKIDQKIEKRERNQIVEENGKVTLIRQGKEDELKIEHTKIEEEEIEKEPQVSVEEEDGINIADLLETTKLEDDK